MEPVYLGGLFITLSFFFVAVMGALAKHALSLPIEVLVFFQSFIALIIILPWALRGGMASIATPRLRLHFIRAVFGLLSQVFMMIAVRHMTLMNSTLLANSTPLFIPTIFWVIFKKKSSTMTWIGILIGFFGVALVLKPGLNLVYNPVSLVALASAFFSALALVAVNRLTLTENSKQILFYYFFWSALLSAPWATMKWRPLGPTERIAISAIGFSMGAAQLLIVKAYRCASANRLAPFNYTVVVFAGLIGWVMWNDTPDVLSLIGVIFVALGGVLSLRGIE